MVCPLRPEAEQPSPPEPAGVSDALVLLMSGLGLSSAVAATVGLLPTLFVVLQVHRSACWRSAGLLLRLQASVLVLVALAFPLSCALAASEPDVTELFRFLASAPGAWSSTMTRIGRWAPGGVQAPFPLGPETPHPQHFLVQVHTAVLGILLSWWGVPNLQMDVDFRAFPSPFSSRSGDTRTFVSDLLRVEEEHKDSPQEHRQGDSSLSDELLGCQERVQQG